MYNCIAIAVTLPTRSCDISSSVFCRADNVGIEISRLFCCTKGCHHDIICRRVSCAEFQAVKKSLQSRHTCSTVRTCSGSDSFENTEVESLDEENRPATLTVESKFIFDELSALKPSPGQLCIPKAKDQEAIDLLLLPSTAIQVTVAAQHESKVAGAYQVAQALGCRESGLDLVFILPEDRYRHWGSQTVVDNVPKTAAERAHAKQRRSRWRWAAAEINHKGAVEFSSKIRQWAIHAHFNPHKEDKRATEIHSLEAKRDEQADKIKCLEAVLAELQHKPTEAPSAFLIKRSMQ